MNATIHAERPGRAKLARRLVVGGLILAGLAGASGIAARRAWRPAVAEGPGFRLEVVDRQRTGHQRAERLVFLDGGKRLAVACPRYLRVVIYRIEGGMRLLRDHDVKLEGRPVGLGVAGSHLIVLQRPSGDARHVEEAWWDVFDATGASVGSRFRLGFDPDDLAVSSDGQTALVLRSGRAEGEWNRPVPSLMALDISDIARPRPLGGVNFEDANDDPERLTWWPEGGRAVVALRGSKSLARIDVTDLERPRIDDRRPLPGGMVIPGGLAYATDGDVRVADAEGGGLWRIATSGDSTLLADAISEFAAIGPSNRPARLIGLGARSGTLEVWRDGERLARLVLANFGEFRPMGLAVAETVGGRLIAVSDRSGGVVLVRMRDF